MHASAHTHTTLTHTTLAQTQIQYRFTQEVQFGHAGAKSGGEAESAQAKNAALAAAGAIVPSSFEDFEPTIARVFRELRARGEVPPAPDAPPPEVPQDLEAARRAGKVRCPTHIVSSICDDRGEEPTYCGVTMSELIEGDATVGDAIALLWFKRRLPKYATRFIESESGGARRIEQWVARAAWGRPAGPFLLQPHGACVPLMLPIASRAACSVRGAVC
jgi:hypothetical protein